MPVKEITSYEEFRKIIDSDNLSAIDFWAEWCQPCKQMTPVFKKFAELDEFKGIDFYTCDTEEQERVMMECNIRTMPSFLAFQSGNKVGECTGSYPQKLQEMLKKAAQLSKKPEAPATASETAAPPTEQKPQETAQATAPSTSAPTSTPASNSANVATVKEIKEITSFDEFKKIRDSDRVSIFDFWAEWCAPCKMMTPLFKKFAALDEFKDLDFYTCDVEEQEDVMYEAGVKSMPSFMAFQSGQKIGESIGTFPQKLQELLKTAAAAAKGPSSTATEQKSDATQPTAADPQPTNPPAL